MLREIYFKLLFSQLKMFVVTAPLCCLMLYLATLMQYRNFPLEKFSVYAALLILYIGFALSVRFIKNVIKFRLQFFALTKHDREQLEYDYRYGDSFDCVCFGKKYLLIFDIKEIEYCLCVVAYKDIESVEFTSKNLYKNDERILNVIARQKGMKQVYKAMMPDSLTKEDKLYFEKRINILKNKDSDIVEEQQVYEAAS